MLTGLAAAATAGGGISGGALANRKVKFKTGMRPRGPARLHRHRAVGPNQAIGGGGRSPARDDWEDISADSGEEYSDSLDSHPVKSHRYAAASEQPAEEFSRTQPDVPDVPNQGYKQREPGEEGGKRRSERKRRKAQRCGCCAPSSLRGRVLALQRHLAILQTARRDAQRSTRELRDANEKITSQLAQRLNVSKQLSQKLTSDLAGVEQQKKVLEMELERWRQIHRTNTPQQLPSTSPQPLETPSPAVLKALEAEVKQLHAKLKSSKAEVTRHTAVNKALRAQLLEREEKLRELQEKSVQRPALSLSVSLSLFISHSVSLSVSLSLSLSHSFSLCFFLFLSLSLTLILCLSISRSLYLSLCFSLILCLSLFLSLYLSHSFFSFSHSHSLYVCLSVCLSFSLHFSLAHSSSSLSHLQCLIPPCGSSLTAALLSSSALNSLWGVFCLCVGAFVCVYLCVCV
uniref:Lebercilin domain-containing protein n=1 Tax=Hucho hucho TaxID=62062 RepID=A0A4W5K269_9TELE